MPDWAKVTYALLLTLIPCLTLTSAAEKSVTWGEPEHLLAGHHSLKEGPPPADSGLVGIRPSGWAAAVLVRVFDQQASLPDLKPRPDATIPARAVNYMIGKGNNSNLFLARLPNAVLSILVAMLLFHATRTLYGVRSGLLALFLYTFSPNILAFARLSTPDLTALGAMFAASFLLLRFLETGRLRLLLLCTGALTLAVLSDGLMVVLLPAFALMMMFNRLLTPQSRRRVDGAAAATVRGTAVFCGVVLICLLAVWAVYRFEMGPLKGVTEYRVPAPNFLRSIDPEASGDGPMAQDSFLYGERRVGGRWWYYFPLALRIKIPLGLIALFALALVVTFVRPRERARRGIGLRQPAGVFLLAAGGGGPNNDGIRPILGVLPFVFVIASRLLADREDGVERVPGPAALVLVSVLGLCFVASALSIYPNYLAYFNESVGGPEGGAEKINASSMDRGQDLPGLARYMNEYGIGAVRMSYFGPMNPARQHGLRLTPEGQLAGWRPKRGGPLWKDVRDFEDCYVAISITRLKALQRMRPEMYEKLTVREPIVRIGNTIYLYRFPKPYKRKPFEK